MYEVLYAGSPYWSDMHCKSISIRFCVIMDIFPAKEENCGTSVSIRLSCQNINKKGNARKKAILTSLSATTVAVKNQ